MTIEKRDSTKEAAKSVALLKVGALDDPASKFSTTYLVLEDTCDTSSGVRNHRVSRLVEKLLKYELAL